MAVNVNWRSIRPLNGGNDKGFEELCSQLARSEVAGRAQFVRKGSPDAGVECYAISDDGSESAWQAKYFFTLTQSQWRQIDESVRTALRKHPRLTRYVVCLPTDLPDARIPGRESALARWHVHVKKWVGWASEQQMTVKFAYWGSSELLERLSRPEHVGRLRFWFDQTGFDHDWFAQRFEEARDTAGPRYTPELHVDLPIAGRFEAFGRTAHFFNRTIALIRGLADEWASACSPGPSRLGKEKDPEVEAAIEAVANDPFVRTARASIRNAIQDIVAAGSAMEIQPSGTLPFRNAADKVEAVEAALDDIVQHLSARQAEHQVFRQYRHQFETFAAKLGKVRAELVEAQRWGGAKLMIVRGQSRDRKNASAVRYRPPSARRGQPDRAAARAVVHRRRRAMAPSGRAARRKEQFRWRVRRSPRVRGAGRRASRAGHDRCTQRRQGPQRVANASAGLPCAFRTV